MNKSQKKYSSKYHLKKEFEIILNKMYIINLDFELYKNLKSGEIKKYITDYIPYTSQIILNSLFNNIILELSKIIIDNSDYKGYENICIKNLLKKYEDNNYYFTNDYRFAPTKLGANVSAKSSSINFLTNGSYNGKDKWQKSKD